MQAANHSPAVREGGGDLAGLPLEHLEHEHAAAGTMLERLSQLTDGYDTSRAACNTHRAAIDGLRELELDMHEHVHEENNILFPRVLAALAA